ncbi:MAG TPA: AMP-binding protein [Trueperaceae bacterium]|nr:AMP-binding protein [Trueperaceae bacterium]
MKPRDARLLHETLLRTAAAAPGKAAVVAPDGRVSYAELLDRALRLARGLQDRGVGRGDRVAVFLDNGVAAVTAVYAALLAGGAFMVVNPQTRADKLRYVLADSGAAAVVAGARYGGMLAALAGELPDLRCVVLVGEGGDAAGAVPVGSVPVGSVPVGSEPVGSVQARADGAGAGDAAAAVVVAYDRLLAGSPPEPRPGGAIALDLAALVYTSGSTGNPKGVMLSHRNMVFTLGSLVEYLRLSEDDRILNVLPLAFDYGLYQVLMSVYLGATAVLETSFAFPMQVVASIRDNGVTVLPGVPTLFAALLSIHRRQPLSMPSVRRITNTAAHLPDDYVPGLLAMCPDALIYKMYGLTECKRVCYLEPELVQAKPSSVGRAIPGTEAFVLGDDGEPVAAGTTGVLHVRGPHVMMGYWNLPEETARMLVPGRYPGERMLNTHDFFRVDGDGLLYFVGRSDDIIKSRGEKVSPVEVENALSGIPGVREVAVVGVPDELLGQAVRAYVVLDRGAETSERAFRRECVARLEPFMVPRDVVFVDDLPRTGSGKVRKKDLIASSAGGA